MHAHTPLERRNGLRSLAFSTGRRVAEMETPTGSHLTRSAVFRAIMFTDVVDSTGIIDRLGDDAAYDLIRRHDRMIRLVVHEHSGHELDRAGDGFLVSFRSVGRAVQCSVAIQRTLALFNARYPDREIHIRIGIGAGNAVSANDVLFGAAVNEAARICAVAGPDQILVSRTVSARCTEQDGRFVELGPVSLRGFSEPVEIDEVKWPLEGVQPRQESARAAPDPVHFAWLNRARIEAAFRRFAALLAPSSTVT
jgi:adenylate cyclase